MNSVASDGGLNEVWDDSMASVAVTEGPTKVPGDPVCQDASPTREVKVTILEENVGDGDDDDDLHSSYLAVSSNHLTVSSYLINLSSV